MRFGNGAGSILGTRRRSLPAMPRIRESWPTLAWQRTQESVESAVNMPEEKRAYASMWQDLYHGRPSHEADSLNGVIIQMGKRMGIPTPMNSFLLETIDRMSREGIKPGLYTPTELQDLIDRRVESEARHG